jgi:hypothetical protein
VAYTTDDLVTEVRRRARLPSASDISSTDILALADQEMSTTIDDVLRNADASFRLTTYTTTLASGTAAYALPSRAVGAGIEEVVIADSAGNRQPVVPLNLHDTWRFANGGRDAMWPGRFGFALEGHELVLYPTPTSADVGLTLRVRYQRQPSQLDLLTNCNAIQQATTTTLIAITDTAVAEIAAASYLDIIRGDGLHDVSFADRLVFSVSGTDVNLDPSTPVVVAQVSGASAGRVDYVARAGYTPYPQVPRTLWPVLVGATVRSVLELLGDRQGMAAAQAVLEQRIAAARSVVTPRARQLPVFLNHDSYLRRGRR